MHGIDHILFGYDHLLFVFALILIVPNLRMLVMTVTAFTLAHSITLALATLGVVHVPGPPVEATIALSILLLACEIARSRTGQPSLTARWPWLVAFSFGLLHGFGFASALSEIGLPHGDIPLALFTFNVGVEIGQLLFIAAVLASLALARRIPIPDGMSRQARPAATYAIGTLCRVLVCGARGGLLVLTCRRATRMWPHYASVLVCCLVAGLAATSFAQQVDVVGGIAAENANLSAQLSADATALDHALVELEDVRKEKRDLEERMQWLERRPAVYALGKELAKTVTEHLRQLPRPERLAAASERRADLLAEASDASLRVERELRELGDLDAATAQRLSAALPLASQEQRAQVEPAVRAALAEQRDLLQRLTAIKRKLMDVLQEADEASRDLERLTQAARAKLTSFLFWMPAAPSTETVGEFGPALAWVLSPANWKTAGEVMQRELARRPFWPVLALVAATTLLALRGRLLHTLVSLSPATVTYERYRIGHTLAALAITFALALPVPMVLWTAGATLAHAPDSQPFALALSDALLVIFKLLLAVVTLAWLLDGRGVAVRHFGWDEVSLSAAARGLRRFAAVFVPLCFVAALNGLDHAPFGNRESLARLAFSLALITLAIFLMRLLKTGSPIMQRLRARAPRSRYVQLHAFWFGPLLALPLAIGGLAAAGYFIAAGYFYGRIVESVFVAIGAVMLYGLIALWVQVQRLHLGHRRDEATARPKEAGPAGEMGSEVAEPRPPELNTAMLGEQTRSLLDMLVTLLAARRYLVGMARRFSRAIGDP